MVLVNKHPQMANPFRKGGVTGNFLGIHWWWAKPERLLDRAIYQTTNLYQKTTKSGGRKMEMVKKFFKDECGATMVEYGLMVALIAIATIGAVNYLQSGVETTFNNAAQQMGGTP